jgi:putative ABC transport system permease protein
VVTADGFARLRIDPDTTYAAVALRRGATVRDENRIARKVGTDLALAGSEGTKARFQQTPPGVVVNIGRVRRVPLVLALIVSAMALLTCLHALIVSVRSRRRDLAVLRAIGGNRRFVTQVVHWQATVLALVPLVVGIPLGLAAGSGGFRVFVDRLGGPPDPALPFLVIAIAAAALVAIANLTAAVPARRARAVAAARLLSED